MKRAIDFVSGGASEPLDDNIPTVNLFGGLLGAFNIRLINDPALVSVLRRSSLANMFAVLDLLCDMVGKLLRDV